MLTFRHMVSHFVEIFSNYNPNPAEPVINEIEIFLKFKKNNNAQKYESGY